LTGDTLPAMEHHDAHASEPVPSDELNLLRAFVNTRDVEGGEDDVGTPELLAAWLRAREQLPASQPMDPDAHARAIAVREGLRALAAANNGDTPDPHLVDDLNRVAGGLPMLMQVGPGDWHLLPAGGGADGFLAGLLGTLVRSMADGSWARIKACHRHDCRWLFVDQSRNRSGTWCSMAGCGSRMKSRAYRARRREATGA
jgi:predicted RNA-binding Zn ribbon-like protein